MAVMIAESSTLKSGSEVNKIQNSSLEQLYLHFTAGPGCVTMSFASRCPMAVQAYSIACLTVSCRELEAIL
jgi:hypothetical protein